MFAEIASRASCIPDIHAGNLDLWRSIFRKRSNLFFQGIKTVPDMGLEHAYVATDFQLDDLLQLVFCITNIGLKSIEARVDVVETLIDLAEPLIDFVEFTIVPDDRTLQPRQGRTGRSLAVLDLPQNLKQQDVVRGV